MGKIALSGVKTMAFKAERGTLLVGDAVKVLTASTWYEVVSYKATGSTLPIKEITAVFKSPATGATIVPASGDSVYPLVLTQICKTDAEFTCEEGTIDVTDDCEKGYNASILDGYATISGSLNGFMKFDDETGEIETGAEEIFGRFLNVVSDNNQGDYDVTAKSNEKLMLFMLLNNDAGIGDIQNWLIVPAILSSLGTGAGLKDAQKRDLSWTKAQGYASLYKRTAASADLLA